MKKIKMMILSLAFILVCASTAAAVYLYDSLGNIYDVNPTNISVGESQVFTGKRVSDNEDVVVFYNPSYNEITLNVMSSATNLPDVLVGFLATEGSSYYIGDINTVEPDVTISLTPPR